MNASRPAGLVTTQRRMDRRRLAASEHDTQMINSFEIPGSYEMHSRTGPLAPQRTVIRNSALAEGKVPLSHRFFLVDGRVIEGYLFRSVNSRLVDELYGQKGSFVSVVDAHCVGTGEVAPYMALNERHIVSIEELPEPLTAHRRGETDADTGSID